MLDLNKFKMGYFILWMNEGGFVGNMIEKAQLDKGFSEEHSRLVHVDVSGGGPFSVRVNPPRTKAVDIRKTYPGRRFIVVRYKSELYEKKSRYKVAFWAASNCNLKYDFWGIIKFKIPFIRHRLETFFCSENCLWSLQKELPGAFGGMEPHKCMPAHFMNPEFFEVVHGGRIKEN